MATMPVVMMSIPPACLLFFFLLMRRTSAAGTHFLRRVLHFHVAGRCTQAQGTATPHPCYRPRPNSRENEVWNRKEGIREMFCPLLVQNRDFLAKMLAWWGVSYPLAAVKQRGSGSDLVPFARPLAALLCSEHVGGVKVIIVSGYGV